MQTQTSQQHSFAQQQRKQREYEEGIRERHLERQRAFFLQQQKNVEAEEQKEQSHSALQRKWKEMQEEQKEGIEKMQQEKKDLAAYYEEQKQERAEKRKKNKEYMDTLLAKAAKQRELDRKVHDAKEHEQQRCSTADAQANATKLEAEKRARTERREADKHLHEQLDAADREYQQSLQTLKDEKNKNIQKLQTLRQKEDDPSKQAQYGKKLSDIERDYRTTLLDLEHTAKVQFDKAQIEYRQRIHEIETTVRDIRMTAEKEALESKRMAHAECDAALRELGAKR